MKFVISENAPKPVGPYSHAVVVENFVFVSGQIPMRKNGEIPEKFEERVEAVIENVRAILNEVGLDLENVVKVTVYLKDLSKFNEFNEVYEKYFKKKPARVVVGVSELPKGVDIEMEVVAFRS
ncbi:endoribonuclease L-PSP [Ferroglobus placidus DSM 10642]|uniref:Endoribonuclease L-PSP n=1 Tax=Ferroglobus placidus (strain DSM 10642 / AEDII12DO) TaxID=589924 RepID=D3RYV7_FERPA|nr:Rid family detoxifying hydrolase [Ferroglobus placidus]ADC65670.1 endoribonuclease L-PSP [Ferroglobus placidus DSM 10642]